MSCRSRRPGAFVTEQTPAGKPELTLSGQDTPFNTWLFSVT